VERFVRAQAEGVVVGGAERKHGESHVRTIRSKQSVGNFMNGAIAAGCSHGDEPSLGCLEGQLFGMTRMLRRTKINVRSQLRAQVFKRAARSTTGRHRIENDAGCHVNTEDSAR